MTIETLDATIAQLQAEARREARLREAEDIYRRFGLGVTAGDPREAAHLRQQALLGAMMVVGSAQLLKVERARIEARGEGLSKREKTERIAQLRRQIERLAAKRELAVREIEGDGFMPRPVHAELAIYRQGDVERLAAG